MEPLVLNTNSTRRMIKPISFFLGLFTVCLVGTQCSTSKNTSAPKEAASAQQPAVMREFRAAWIASVANINWPSNPGLPVAAQKKEAIELLDFLARNNFNAVILQVRPQCDALYQSGLEPWSYYLTGVQGEAPDPFYDPLQFWIDEAHKRSLELHAWLNPYRAHHVAGGPVSDQSIVKTRPELVVELETGYYWMDPSAKETQDHSYNVVLDIVKRYDVDGIHFDDYFYPYSSYNNDKDFPDDEGWSEYQSSGGKLSRADWRRDAVNAFIKRVYKGIKAEKKHVKFGLSPFGIWRPDNPPSIKGFDQYDKLYADAKLWLNKGWIDYWTPQLYWPINRIPQSFPVLLGWWDQQNLKNRHFWPGINLGNKNTVSSADEAINQIMITRGMLSNSPGVVHWHIGSFMNSTQLTEALIKGPYKEKALVPASPWLDNKAPDAPAVSVSTENDSLRISWTQTTQEDLSSYVIYKHYGDRWTYDIADKHSLSELISAGSYSQPITETSLKISPLNNIAVTAIDRSGNESAFTKINVSHLSRELIPEQAAVLEKLRIEERSVPVKAVQPIVLYQDTEDMGRCMDRIRAAGYNTVIFRLSDQSEGLPSDIEAAHSRKMKCFILIEDEKNKCAAIG